MRLRGVKRGIFTEEDATSFAKYTSRCDQFYRSDKIDCRLTTRALGPRIVLAGRCFDNLISHDAKTPRLRRLGLLDCTERETSIRDSQQAEQPTPVAPAYPAPSSLLPLRSFETLHQLKHHRAPKHKPQSAQTFRYLDDNVLRRSFLLWKMAIIGFSQLVSFK